MIEDLTPNLTDDALVDEITFWANDTMPWVMKLCMRADGKARIFFNREAYPEITEDEFAEAVVKILESLYPAVDF